MAPLAPAPWVEAVAPCCVARSPLARTYHQPPPCTPTFTPHAQGQGLSGQLAPLLSELGMELAQLVSDPLATEQLADQYSGGAGWLVGCG